MSNKRGGVGDLNAILKKQAKTDADSARARQQQESSESNRRNRQNPYLSNPIKQPEAALAIFLQQARSSARKSIPPGSLPIKKPCVEIEARIGILKLPFGLHDARVVSSGAKNHARAFECTSQEPRALFVSGITRSHYVHWTQSGLSEVGPISQALGVTKEHAIKRDLAQLEYVETVYGGYKDDVRVCFPGVHPQKGARVTGKMEHKAKLDVMDVTLPAAPYDLRMTLATEKTMDSSIQDAPPAGWTSRRIKRRRCYTRRDKSIAWQLDVTEVTTFSRSQSDSESSTGEVTFEIEMELNEPATLQLVNETNEAVVQKMVGQLAQQLWWMLYQLNPLSDVLDVENYLVDHPDKNASKLAVAQCGALKKFMDSHQQRYESPISNPDLANKNLSNLKFTGCMPVNFSRHNIEEVQQGPENGYFLSEKTDGVRHFMIFTGTTAVLIDRAMVGKQVVLGTTSKENGKQDQKDPMSSVLPLIKAGTVLDGEVVMHRKLRRPIFIVFDVLAISATEPVLHLPFEQRLYHLKQASFRTPTANRDMFAESAVMDPNVALPLVRKNFVKRMDLDNLISHVVEERGTRSYRNGDIHYHLTDGIIFQPNTPYVCGTDHRLLKWKYLDTVTIDVEILPPRNNKNDDDEDRLYVGVLGEEGTMVDMSRYVHLPSSERQRLEADRAETGSKIAEVGFDATTGEWYYLTMRPDKVAPNHISTVLGTLLELAESLTTEELRYRMSVPVGGRDTYRKDVRGMQKQLLDHQRKKNKAAAAVAASTAKS